MKSWLKLFFASAVLGLGVGSSSIADPLDPAHVPGDSKWVVHVDMDAVRKSGIWKPVYDRLQQNPQFLKQVQDVEAVFNARFPEDLHDVTLAGAAFGDKAGVVLVHATVDRKQVERMLSTNPSYASEPRGNHAVLTWDDKGQTNYGGFVSDDQFIIGQSKDRVAAVFDTLDGKAAALKPDATLVKGTQNGLLIYVAGDELAKLRQAQIAKSPLLTQMQSAWITLNQEKDNLVLHLNVNATDAATADKMKQAAEGGRAMLALAAGEPEADPKLKLLADFVASAQLAVKESSVTVSITVPQTTITDLLDKNLGAKQDEAPKP